MKKLLFLLMLASGAVSAAQMPNESDIVADSSRTSRIELINSLQRMLGLEESYLFILFTLELPQLEKLESQVSSLDLINRYRVYHLIEVAVRLHNHSKRTGQS